MTVKAGTIYSLDRILKEGAVLALGCPRRVFCPFSFGDLGAQRLIHSRQVRGTPLHPLFQFGVCLPQGFFDLLPFRYVAVDPKNTHDCPVLITEETRARLDRHWASVRPQELNLNGGGQRLAGARAPYALFGKCNRCGSKKLGKRTAYDLRPRQTGKTFGTPIDIGNRSVQRNKHDGIVGVLEDRAVVFFTRMSVFGRPPSSDEFCTQSGVDLLRGGLSGSPKA
jgi:hypothetical protein